MRCTWSVQSLHDLDAIYAYIAADSPIYAQRLIDRIIERGEQIARFPGSGRIVPEMNRMEIREVIEGSYRIIYRITSDGIEVITVLHGAMQFPEDMNI